VKRIRKLATVGLLIAVGVGGGRAVGVEAGAGHSAAGAVPAQTQSVNGGTGKVLETMNSGGYTYVRADIGGTAVWAATQQFSVQPGDVVVIPEGTPMESYYSKTLDRTFDVVYFVPSIAVQGASANATAPLDAHGGHAAPPPEHGGSAAARPPSVPISGIKRADGGKTVEEVFQEKAGLAGTEVVVRGKVVKVNLGIMGKNWLHVQDGSGAAGTNDLVVTTDIAASVGDTVLVKGKVSTNKDFGAGYTYDVIIEGAAVTKE
jgi:hypothetical protein